MAIDVHIVYAQPRCIHQNDILVSSNHVGRWLEVILLASYQPTHVHLTLRYLDLIIYVVLSLNQLDDWIIGFFQIELYSFSEELLQLLLRLVHQVVKHRKAAIDRNENCLEPVAQ